MREILFRGKTISGEWVEGNYSHLRKDHGSVKAGHYISNSAGVPFAYQVIPSTIGQFTGLHDRDGKRIFEGDRILLKWVEPNYQTHRGDNIPGGAYTEPDEAIIGEAEFIIVFEGGAFRLGGDFEAPYYDDLLASHIGNWWEEMCSDYDFTDGAGEYNTEKDLKEAMGMVITNNIHES